MTIKALVMRNIHSTQNKLAVGGKGVNIHAKPYAQLAQHSHLGAGVGNVHRVGSLHTHQRHLLDTFA